jgi:hypothetical protein
MHRCVRHGEQGGALIVALAVLAVFSCMAVTFCTVMRIEGAASTNHLLGTRAAMIAEAGVHRAVAELAASELDDPTGRSGGWLAQDHGTPIETTTDLSWPRQDDLGPYTGLLGGTFVSNGDRYLVRVADTSSRIDLGARPDFLGPALDALGRAIALNTPGRRDPVRGRGAEAAALVRARGGVRSIREIEAFLGTEDAAILADYTTTHAVRDPRTTSWTGEVDERGYPVFASDPRAPISVNTASWPVLVAVLTGVIGADGAPVTNRRASSPRASQLGARTATRTEDRSRRGTRWGGSSTGRRRARRSRRASGTPSLRMRAPISW